MTRSEIPVASPARDPGRVWRWWCGAMWQWVPVRWRSRWLREPDQLLFAPADGRVQVVARLGGQSRALGELALPLSAAALQPLLPVGLADLPRRWLLPEQAVLCRPMRLPAAAASRLDAVLGFEIDRQTPFSPDQVHYASRLLGDAGNGQIDAALVVLPRPALQASLADAGEVASTLAAVDVGEVREGGWGINLLPPSQRARQRIPQAGLRAAAWGLALLALWGAAALVLHNREQALSTLQAEVDAEAPQAREVARQRQQVQGMVDGVTFLDQHRRQRPPVSAVWSALTERLPDGTWVERLAIEGDQLQLTGLSDQASGLVALLDDSPLWERAALAGVLQAEPGQRHERFTLSAVVRSTPVDNGMTGGGHADLSTR